MLFQIKIFSSLFKYCSHTIVLPHVARCCVHDNCRDGIIWKDWWGQEGVENIEKLPNHINLHHSFMVSLFIQGKQKLLNLPFHDEENNYSKQVSWLMHWGTVDNNCEFRCICKLLCMVGDKAACNFKHNFDNWWPRETSLQKNVIMGVLKESLGNSPSFLQRGWGNYQSFTIQVEKIASQEIQTLSLSLQF